MSGNDVLFQIQNNKLEKLNYGVLTLALATLALSFQFSPSMGFRLPYALVGAWATLLVSAVIGGVRIYFDLSMATRNYYLNFSRENTKSHEKVLAQVQSNPRTLLVGATADELKTLVTKGKETQKDIESHMDKTGTWISRLFIAQYILLLLGFVLIGVFTVVNYLEKACAA